MPNVIQGCAVKEAVLPRGIRAVTIENEWLLVSILPDKGADIYQLIYKPKGIDLLWKAPWGLKPPGRGVTTASNSQAAWMEYYAGGWQEIFPNGGAACDYKGSELNFHGEASTIAWDYDIVSDTSEEAAVAFSTRTYRSPFEVRRTMVLRKNQKFVEINEKITNLAEEDMHYMWGHHPAFGAPFIDEGAIINLPEGSWIQSQNLESASARMPPDTRSRWPLMPGKNNDTLDLSVIPDRNARSADLAFIGGFAEGWYGITNPKLGMGFGMAWPVEIFPYMWFWQEFKGSFGYPWYGSNYVTAIEPFTSYDASGLANCIENQTARMLKPGETVEAAIVAVCYESTRGVQRVDRNGNIHIIN